MVSLDGIWTFGPQVVNQTSITQHVIALNVLLEQSQTLLPSFEHLMLLNIFIYKKLIFNRQLCGWATHILRRNKQTPRLKPQTSFVSTLHPGWSSPGLWLQISSDSWLQILCPVSDPPWTLDSHILKLTLWYLQMKAQLASQNQALHVQGEQKKTQVNSYLPLTLLLSLK